MLLVFYTSNLSPNSTVVGATPLGFVFFLFPSGNCGHFYFSIIFFPTKVLTFITEPKHQCRNTDKKRKNIFPIKHIQLLQQQQCFQCKMQLTLTRIPYMCHLLYEASYRPNLVLLQRLLLELYLILVPVFVQIHWGIGLFCFCLLARNQLILEIL